MVCEHCCNKGPNRPRQWGSLDFSFPLCLLLLPFAGPTNSKASLCVPKNAGVHRYTAHWLYVYAWIHRSTQSIHCLCCHLENLQDHKKHSQACSLSPNSICLDTQPLLCLQSPQTLAINPPGKVALIIGLPISSLGCFFSSFRIIPACQLLQLDWSSHFSCVSSLALDLSPHRIQTQNLSPVYPVSSLTSLQDLLLSETSSLLANHT